MLTRGLGSSTEPPWYKARGFSGRVKIKKKVGYKNWKSLDFCVRAEDCTYSPDRFLLLKTATNIALVRFFSNGDFQL